MAVICDSCEIELDREKEYVVVSFYVRVGTSRSLEVSESTYICTYSTSIYITSISGPGLSRHVLYLLSTQQANALHRHSITLAPVVADSRLGPEVKTIWELVLWE